MTFKVSPDVYQCIVDFSSNTKFCSVPDPIELDGETPEAPYELNAIQRVLPPSPSPFEFSQFGHAVEVYGSTMVVSSKYSSFDSDNNSSGDDNGYIDIYNFVDYKWVHVQHIENPEPDSTSLNDYFGHDIAINEEYIVVGCIEDNTNDVTDSSEGSVFVFKKTGNTYVLDQKLENPNAVLNSNFGMVVRIDPVTNRIAVLSEDGVDIFENNAGTWSHDQRVTFHAGNKYAVGDVVEDDEMVLVGDKIFATRRAGGNDDGEVFYGTVDKYELSEGTWSHVGYISPDPEYIIGTMAANSSGLFIVQRVSNNSGGGHSIKEYDLNGNLVSTITPPTPAFAVEADDFAAVLECNDRYLIAGCPFSDDNFKGLAIVYEHGGSEWVVKEYLRNDHPNDNRFGYALAVTNEHFIVSSNYAAVGTSGDMFRIGAIKPYLTSAPTNEPVVFNGYETIFPEYTTIHPDTPNGNYSNETVAVYDNYLFSATSYYDPPAGSTQGSIFIYQYTGTTMNFVQRIDNHNGEETFYFGNTISADGDWLVTSDTVVPSAGDANGRVYIYQKSGSTWSLFQTLADPLSPVGNSFGSHVAVHGDVLVVGASDTGFSGAEGGGAAHIYRYDGVDFKLEQTIDRSSPADGGFGFAVDAHGDYVIVGAPQLDKNAVDGGASYIFRYNGTTWDLQATIVDNAYANNADYLGFTVSISDEYAVIGCTLDDISGATDGGSARILRRDGDVWTLLDFVYSETPTASMQFGFASDIVGDYIFIAETDEGSSGRVYIYRVENDQMVLKHTLTSPNSDPADVYGGFYTDSIAASDKILSVTAPGASDVGTETGSTYTYEAV